MENQIISRLREHLGAARNATAMFRVFGRFNALFVRPKIRGAIQEWQTQLIDSVKDDIRRLQDKFTSSYRVRTIHEDLYSAEIFSCSTLKHITLRNFVIYRLSLVPLSGPSRLRSNSMPTCDALRMCWAKAGSFTPKARSCRVRAQVFAASSILAQSTRLGCTKLLEETCTSLVGCLRLLGIGQKLVSCNWESTLIRKSLRRPFSSSPFTST